MAFDFQAPLSLPETDGGDAMVCLEVRTFKFTPPGLLYGPGGRIPRTGF